MLLTELTYKFKASYRIIKMVLTKTIGITFFLASLCAMLLIVYEFGFSLTGKEEHFINEIYHAILKLFLFGTLLRIAIAPEVVWKEKGFWVELIVIAALIFVVTTRHNPAIHDTILKQANHILTYVLLVFISIIQLSKDIVTTLQRHLKPELMFAYSFLFIILSGTFLLMLPNAHHGQMSFINALFTSTSAVCVTGLTVVDTSATFTTTGQVILILLIQIGGLGVMTFTSFFAMSFFSQTSFQDQMVLKNILNENSLNNIFRSLFYILLTTIVIEAIGAYVIYIQIADVPEKEIPEKVFFALFHAISAFCNAGFSTLSDNLYNPSVRHLYGFQSWMALLIILGGIGFPIVFNYGKLLRHTVHNLINKITGQSEKYSEVRVVSTTTRIVIPATIILVVAGTALFWLFENDNSLKGLPLIGKLATSFMGAVTPRTAGFNNVPMETMLPTTVFLTMILMWIGASPMSTGGGIKTTTFVIGLKNIYTTIKGQNRIELAKRQLTIENVNRANSIILLSLLWIGMATGLLLVLAPHATVRQALFEILSAIGTVGLTLDLTPTLSDSGKLLVSLTMFVGRVGLITLLTGFVKQQSVKNYTYADDNVIL